MSNPFQILGVQESANDQEIKKAYKKLALQHHPDKGGDVKQFQIVSEAYDQIKTAEKRQQYQQQKQFGGFARQSQPFDFDIFEQFNQMFGDNVFQQRRPRRNKNMTITVPIPLEEAFRGIKKQISVQLGSGQRQVVDLDIPAGVNNGMTLNYKGLGDNVIKNVPPGDLQVRLQINRHPFFERKNHDLYTSKQINAFEAMLGTKVLIKTIDNKTIKASITPGTQPGTFIRIPNEGMPIMRTNNRGHLFVRIDINIPSNLSQDEKDVIAKNFIN